MPRHDRGRGRARDRDRSRTSSPHVGYHPSSRCTLARRMPIYEYRCENGHLFEVMQKIADPPVTDVRDVRGVRARVFHPIAVHFKGSGFYNTDYGTSKRKRELDASAKAGADKHDAKSKDKKDSSSSSSGSSGSSDSSGSSGSVRLVRRHLGLALAPPGGRIRSGARAARRLRTRVPRRAPAGADVAAPDPLDARRGWPSGSRSAPASRGRRALRAAGRPGSAPLLAIEPLRAVLGLAGAAGLIVLVARTLHSAFRVRQGRWRPRSPGRARAFLTALGGTASNPSTIASWAAIFAATSVAGAAGLDGRRGRAASRASGSASLVWVTVLGQRRRGRAARGRRPGAPDRRRDRRRAACSASAARSPTAACAPTAEVSHAPRRAGWTSASCADQPRRRRRRPACFVASSTVRPSAAVGQRRRAGRLEHALVRRRRRSSTPSRRRAASARPCPSAPPSAPPTTPTAAGRTSRTTSPCPSSPARAAAGGGRA